MFASGFVPLPVTSQPRGSLTLARLRSALIFSPVAACEWLVVPSAAAPLHGLTGAGAAAPARWAGLDPTSTTCWERSLHQPPTPASETGLSVRSGGRWLGHLGIKIMG